MTPACQCHLPADQVKLFCERHQCVKYRRLVELCNTGARGEAPGVGYWQIWEQGRGPGQQRGDKAVVTRPILPVVSEEEQDRRRGICFVCEHFSGEFCQKCKGCKNSRLDHWRYLIRRGKCPIAKWDKI